MKTVSLATILFVFSLSYNLKAQEEDIVEYINTWKNVAINQMVLHGVPASITLAQGVLESGHGKSKLAVRANNHFGIKCNGWKGETYFKDDDRPNECFRKYGSASASYEDHSLFLTSRSRYASLFDLDVTDYKAWAKGLKSAGYATNPVYHKLLIKIIEDYNLDDLDEEGNMNWVATSSENMKSAGNKSITSKNQHKIYYNPNKTKYVIAGEHDTFYQIASEFGVNIRQMNRWNDFPQTKDLLEKGDKVYIMRKRKKPASNEVRVEIDESKPLWKVSQEHGIQLSTLMKLNEVSSPDAAMQEGDIVYLK
jgi:LysM repeat protein